MKQISELRYDNLFAGDAEVVTEVVTIKMGEVIPKFSIVAINPDGKGVTPAKDDETLKLYGILAEDVNATDKDIKSVVYLSGEFNSNTVIVPKGRTLEDFKVGLREIGIYLKESLKNY